MPIAFALLIIAGSCNYTTVRKTELPNIVLILADDLGYGDLSCYGASGYTTPNLDRLASEGMRFTDFVVAQPICSASRAGLLTGCYPNRIGISAALTPHAEIGLNTTEKTIAEVLKEKGYATGIFGKWHLGHHTEFLPLQHGFDEYVGLPYSNDMWRRNYDGSEATPETHPRKAGFPPLPLMEGNEVLKEIVAIEDQAELTGIYTEHAVKFIRKNRNNPFFLYLPHTMPHVPLAVSGKFAGKSDQGMYGDVMMEIDWSVGRILSALEELNLSKNTLVIFTSDNGPWMSFGDHAGSTGGFREGKATCWEGGFRVPCIIRWPTVVQPGSVCNKLASTIDLLPTFVEITGAALPENKIDGVSILSLFRGEQSANPREVFYYYFRKNHLAAVRKNQWKLILPHRHTTYEGFLPGRNGLPGETGELNTEKALYDIRRDPGERYDVKKMYPEVVEELEKIAEQARKDLGDNLPNRKGSQTREPGFHFN